MGCNSKNSAEEEIANYNENDNFYHFNRKKNNNNSNIPPIKYSNEIKNIKIPNSERLIIDEEKNSEKVKDSSGNKILINNNIINNKESQNNENDIIKFYNKNENLINSSVEKEKNGDDIPEVLKEGKGLNKNKFKESSSIENNKKEKNSERKKEDYIKTKKTEKNGVTIVQKLKDFLPEDITKEEIMNLIYEAFRGNLVKDNSLFIPGETITYMQAEDLSEYIYNLVKKNGNEDNNLLDKLNIKIDIVSVNEKINKEKNEHEPSEQLLDEIYKSYGNESNNIKILKIEFK